MSNLNILVDSSKFLQPGTHFKFTEPTNLTIVQKYLVYTTSGKIDTFETVQLEKTVLTKTLKDLVAGEQYIIQLIIETATSTLQSNSLSFIATSVSEAPVIQSVVPIDNAVIVNLGFNSNNGSPLTEAKFTLTDGTSIFTIKKSLNNHSPSQFILSDNIANYKNYELAVAVKNERGYSSNTQAIAFKPSDIPNAPVLAEPLESDSKVLLSWSRPSDYNEWSVESYSAIVHIEYKKQSASTWQSVEIDVKEDQLTSYEIDNLDNGSLYDIKMKYQNDNGHGVHSSVVTALPHKQANAPETRLDTIDTNFISIFSTVGELGGLAFKKLVCEVHDGDELKETIEQDEIPSNTPNMIRLNKNNYSWLVSGTKYKFVASVITQSEDANMSDELEGLSSEVEATYFDNVPEMSALSLASADSQMSISWSALSGLDMPVKDLKYSVFMDGLLVANELESTEFVKSELVNGNIHSFVVKATFNLVEAPRIFISESEPAYLSAFRAPDAPTDLVVSNLASTSLTLSWSAGDLNGTKHLKYKVFDGDTLLKEAVNSTVTLTGLTKGRDYNLSVLTVSTRDELVGQAFMSEKSSVRSTRPFSAPSKVRSLLAEVLDRSLKVTWSEPLDLGGYTLSKYNLMYIQSPPNQDSQWVTMENVSSGVVLSGLENGQLYQIRVKVCTSNTELQQELVSEAQLIYAKPLSTATSPRNVSIVDQDGSFKVSWEAPESDNGATVTSYKLYVLNQTSQMTQTVTLDASLREKVHVASNGVKYLVSISAMNSQGESPKSPELESVPFGVQSVSNVSVVGQTVSWSVGVNGRMVKDVSVLAIDSSPDVNENLYQTSQNQDNVIIGSQSFSKTFNFNHTIQKYLIVVRSAEGQVFKTNFNM